MSLRFSLISTLLSFPDGATIDELRDSCEIDYKRVDIQSGLNSCVRDGLVKRGELIPDGQLFELNTRGFEYANKHGLSAPKKSALKMFDSLALPKSDPIKPPAPKKQSLDEIVDSELSTLADMKYANDPISRGLCSSPKKSKDDIDDIVDNGLAALAVEFSNEPIATRLGGRGKKSNTREKSDEMMVVSHNPVPFEAPKKPVTPINEMSDLEIKTFKNGALPSERDAGAHYRFSYNGVNLDPYRIAQIYGITDPAQFTVLKKILCAGQRGHKSEVQDWLDCRCAIDRKIEMLREDGVHV